MKSVTQHRSQILLWGILCAAGLCYGPAFARAEDTTLNSQTDNSEEPVQLNPYIVEQSSMAGYYANQSLAGARYAKNVLDIAGSIGIVNRVLIDDLNATDVNQPLLFGVSGVTRQSKIETNLSILGFRTTYALRNGVRIGTASPQEDTYETERIEVIKGPAALITGINASNIGGTINVITYQPTEKFQGYVSANLSQYNYNREIVHASGPAYKGHDLELLYQVTLGRTKANSWRASDYIDEKFVGGTLRLLFGPDKSSAVTIDAEQFDSHKYSYYEDFMIPSADKSHMVYNDTFFPSSFAAVQPQYEQMPNLRRYLQVELDHTFGRIVSTRLFYSMSSEKAIFQQGSVNFAPITQSFFTDHIVPRSHAWYAYWTQSKQLQWDVVAKYDTGFLHQETSAGFDWLQTDFGQSDVVLGTLPSINVFNPDYSGDAAVFQQFFSGGGPGYNKVGDASDGLSSNTSYYGQHSISFWKDRITLVGALRREIPGTSRSLTYITKTYSESRAPQVTVHKYGIVVKPTQNTSVFYDNATNYFPQRTSVLNRGTPYELTQHDSLGQIDEAGAKCNLLNGLLSGSVSAFHLKRTNVRTDIDQYYTQPNGTVVHLQGERDTATKGWQADLASRVPLAGHGQFDFLLSYYDGKTVQANGTPGGFAPTYISSFVAKWTFTHGPLKGFSIGSALRKQSTMYDSGRLVQAEPVNGDIFASYEYRHFSIHLTVTNFTDTRYVIVGTVTPTAQFAYGGQVNDPRMINVGVRYSF